MKAISGGERGSPGRAVQAGIRGIELKLNLLLKPIYKCWWKYHKL